MSFFVLMFKLNVRRTSVNVYIDKPILTSEQCLWVCNYNGASFGWC